MPIFRVKSVKIYTGQKNLHWRRRPRRRQLSGVTTLHVDRNNIHILKLISSGLQSISMKIDRHDAWSRRMRKSADSKAIIGVQIRVCRRFTWDWASRPPSPRILTLDTLCNIIAPHSVFATRCEQNSLCLVAFINSYKTLTNLCWCEKVSGKKYYNALVLQNSALNTGCFLLVPPNSEKMTRLTGSA